jgi:hypothetical protein
MTRLLLIVCLALLGCDLGVTSETEPTATNPPVDTHSTLVPGVAGVFFTEGTTAEQARQLVDSMGLAFKFAPSGTPLNGVVLVPEGSESDGVVKFKSYPIVKTADRIVVAWTS